METIILSENELNVVLEGLKVLVLGTTSNTKARIYSEFNANDPLWKYFGVDVALKNANVNIIAKM